MRFYDLLKHQVLFQGMSSDDYRNVVAFMHFGFETVMRNAVIASPEMPCKRLLMITEGTVDVETVSADGKLNVREYLKAPMTIEPERLFGINQRYNHTYKASSRCHILSLSKNDLLQLNADYLIFRINLLNYLATLSQRQQDYDWQMMPETHAERLRMFFMHHVLNKEGEKVFRIRMVDLASYFGISRLEISEALNDLDERNLIKLQRGMITIPDLTAL